VKNFAIARRYAKALLLIGKENGELEAYREELETVTGLFDQNRELKHILTNPLHDMAQRKKTLQMVVKRLELSSVVASFLTLLFDKGRIGFLDSINQFYQRFADEIKGIARASLVSATELSSETVEKIGAVLSKRTGKTVFLDVSVDPGLIGGVVTKIGDLVLDGSIKTQLLNMKESLKGSESV
jgi:F-type H+-transporting ATPase subunit delta